MYRYNSFQSPSSSTGFCCFIAKVTNMLKSNIWSSLAAVINLQRCIQFIKSFERSTSYHLYGNKWQINVCVCLLGTPVRQHLSPATLICTNGSHFQQWPAGPQIFSLVSTNPRQSTGIWVVSLVKLAQSSVQKHNWTATCIACSTIFSVWWSLLFGSIP